MKETERIGSLKGIGEKTEKLFQKVGVETVGDILRYYPRAFEIFEEPVPVGNVEEGKINTVAGKVFGRIQVSGNTKMQVTTLYLKDLTGTLKVIWFRMPFLRNTLKSGGIYIFRGKKTPLSWSIRKFIILPQNMKRSFTPCSRSIRSRQD